jgi:hypothetical protein
MFAKEILIGLTCCFRPIGQALHSVLLRARCSVRPLTPDRKILFQRCG